LTQDIVTGVVLGSTDFGEADRLIHLLTRDRGRITARARGARRSRKRYGGRLDRFSLVRCHLRLGKGNRAALGDVDLVQPFLGIRSDLIRTAMADHMIELVRLVARDGESNERLFGLTIQALSTLDAGPTPAEGWHLALTLTLLEHAGLAMAVHRCCACGRAADSGQPSYFSLAAGGVLCDEHGPDDPNVVALNRRELSHLQRLDGVDLAHPGAADGRERDDRAARDLIRRFCTYHLERRLRSAAFLDQMLDAL
jgi:DNA repair protein RecO (recombination protein O)